MINSNESAKVAPTWSGSAHSSGTGPAEVLETRELRSRFSILSAIGIQYSISATPIAVGSYIIFILGAGGSPFFFWAFIVTVFGNMLVCASMAEIASAYPHASGQVFWTAALAPPKYSRFLSYWNGATTTLAWTFANAGTYVFAALIWSSTMQVRYPSWEVQTYQVFLMSLGFAFLGVVLNTWLFNFYPFFAKFMVYFINLSTVYLLVALLVRTHPKASAHTVFIEVVNETGWSSNVVVFFLCFLPGSTAVACFDTACHMSEEMDQPERQVPLVMIGGSLLCALSAIPMIVVYLFCTSKPDNLLNPVGGQPIFQIFKDGLQSEALLTVAMVIYCITFFSSCPATIATGSRLVWSFAKHGGLPFSKWIGYVEPKNKIPINAVYLLAGVSAAIGALLFGPSTILNGVFGAAAVCFFFSYGLPIWLNVLSGRRQLPSDRYFNLGKFGMVINIVTIVWQVILVTFLCFPIYQPVTTANMNWASLCAVVALIIFAINWVLHGKKHYHSPKALYVEGIHGHQDEIP